MKTAKAFAKVLGDIGWEQNVPKTPQRWLKFMKHYLQPYDPREDLGVHFPYEHRGDTVEHRSMKIQRNIPYTAVCAHHLLPVLGHATVAYIPNDKITGLSKLTRVVYGVTHREPSLQEEVGLEIADLLMMHLNALGSACIITAIHGCMACRGVEVRDVETITSALRGVFYTKPEARQELLALMGMKS